MPLWTQIDETPLREDGQLRRRTYRTSVPGGWLVLVTVAVSFADGSPSHEEGNAITFAPDPQNKWRLPSSTGPGPTPDGGGTDQGGSTDQGGNPDQGGGDTGGQGDGVPRQVLADALTASGYVVDDVEKLLTHIEDAALAHKDQVYGPADVRTILDEAVREYGGPTFGKFTDEAVELFVASLLASGLTFKTQSV